MGEHCLVEDVLPVDVPGIRQVRNAGGPLHGRPPGFRDHSLAGFVVHAVVGAFPEPGHYLPRLGASTGIVAGRSADDQRCARLVEQQQIHFIHHCEVQRPEDQFVRRHGEVVAQIVEDQLVVGYVGDVRGVGLFAGFASFLRVQILGHHPDTEAHEPVDGPHPLGVAGGQVIVHRHQVHAPAGKSIERHGQCGHQGLSFTGLHLGHRAEMQSHGAQDLHIVRAHAHRSRRHLPHQRVGLHQQVVKGFAQASALPKTGGHFSQLSIRPADQGSAQFFNALQKGAPDRQIAPGIGADFSFKPAYELQRSILRMPLYSHVNTGELFAVSLKPGNPSGVFCYRLRNEAIASRLVAKSAIRFS